jgi:PPOX class probable F420-dependent enzyme
MDVTIESLARGKYLALTTFRKDGTKVTTPVWLVREADTLLVATEATSGKARRIRNNPSVLVGSCDVRGRLTGPQVSANAQLQDPAQTQRTSDVIKRRYGLLGWLFLRRSAGKERVGITISLSA